MFEWLFKYPPAVFLHGQLLLRSAWPRWLLVLGVVLVGVLLAGLMRGRRAADTRSAHRWRLPLIWLLQWALAAAVMVLLWRPAVAINELVPQANIIAVLVDDSRSMGIADNGSTRLQQATQALRGDWLNTLGRNFQTRLYRFDSSLVRLSGPAATLTATGPATHIGAVLDQFASDTASVPVGAIVLLSDGGDNGGRIDRSTIEALRQRHIAVHTVGFGATRVPRDIELQNVALTARALAHSRVTAMVEVSQSGFAARHVNVTVRDAARLLATRDLVLGADGATASAELTFDLPDAGPRILRFAVSALAGETNTRNNELTRLVNVESGPRRILYVEGEPRWEYKFIRRAEDDDKAVQLVSMLRTTENKIYRQGVKDGLELADGFPTRPEDLFGYDGIIMGSVDAGYFNAAQQALMREFVDRRGGGLLFLGGRQALADGVWGGSQLNELLPVTLPMIGSTFRRENASVSLTAAGADSPVTRLLDDRTANMALWNRLPQLADFQNPGVAKPGAVELAQMHVAGRSMPLLVTENYGRGRTAVLATGGTWRWQMSLPLGDPTHSVFWHQLLHWLVSDTRGQLSAQVSASTLQDDGHVQLLADVRDRSYLPATDAVVNAHLIGPDRLQADVALRPVPGQPGRYQTDWTAPAVGMYVADLTATQGSLGAGHDTVAFQREDGVAENFHTAQNVDLLKSLAADTGGRYWQVDDLAALARAIPFSNAGVSVQKFQDLWNMPAVFLLLMLLPLCEWLLRRRWGVV
ncbi:MAG TPA: hypothetical protein VMF03_14810 [Steroidobacteraceae bacterium]|nr:hypothetical protein [Steroidobacteraceae bacterium]